MNPHLPGAKPSDADLLDQAARGDSAALGELYDRYAAVLFSLALKILMDEAGAEDVLQDVFVQIWEKAGQYDPQLGQPLSWVITLTRNKAIDRLRGIQRSERLLDAAAGETGPSAESIERTASDDIIDKETAKLLRSALGRLPSEQRQAIELAFFRGLTQTEIAEALRTPLGTVKARVRRGMMQLRESLAAPLEQGQKTNAKRTLPSDRQSTME